MSSGWNGLYERAPIWLQNAVLTAFSARLYFERYGGRFGEYKQLLSDMERAPAARLGEYQEQQLRRIVEHAYTTVPYYRRIFDERRLTPADIRGVADLPKLPLLTRKDVLRHFDDLRSRAVPMRQLRLGHTSGTTGSPLEIYYDRNVVAITYALMDRQYRWAGAVLGYRGDRIAVARGNVVVPVAQKRAPFWRYNRFQNQLLLSSFHLSAENLPAYIAELERFRPAVIDGYPSTCYLLARYMLAMGRTLPVRAVITASETLFDFQREAIEQAFECRVFDYFAAAERVIFATECERHQGHHLSMEYGVTEIVSASGEPLQNGAIGNMVGTSLHNYGMPLIRYVTNDMSAIKSSACVCRRALPLMEDVSTKAEDIIALSDGRFISPSVLTHPFKPMHSVEQSQIVQEDYDRIVIKLVPNASYKAEEGRYLIDEFRKRLGDDVTVDIELVDELPRTRAGKFKWVISRVDKGIKVS